MGTNKANSKNLKKIWEHQFRTTVEFDWNGPKEKYISGRVEHENLACGMKLNEEKVHKTKIRIIWVFKGRYHSQFIIKLKYLAKPEMQQLNKGDAIIVVIFMALTDLNCLSDCRRCQEQNCSTRTKKNFDMNKKYLYLIYKLSMTQENIKSYIYWKIQIGHLVFLTEIKVTVICFLQIAQLVEVYFKDENLLLQWFISLCSINKEDI